MGDLLSKDYMPCSTLATAEHIVKKPKFPAVDAHNQDGFWASAVGWDGPNMRIRGYGEVDQLVRITDQCGIKTAAEFQPHFRFLETADEYFQARPWKPLSRINGMDLPDEALEEIYQRNAERVMPRLV